MYYLATTRRIETHRDCLKVNQTKDLRMCEMGSMIVAERQRSDEHVSAIIRESG
jgi:hypothetical protein